MTAHLELRMQEGSGAAESGAALLDDRLASAEEEQRVEHGEADWIDKDGGQRKRQDHVDVLGRILLDADVRLRGTARRNPQPLTAHGSCLTPYLEKRRVSELVCREHLERRVGDKRVEYEEAP